MFHFEQLHKKQQNARYIHTMIQGTFNKQFNWNNRHNLCNGLSSVR